MDVFMEFAMMDIVIAMKDMKEMIAQVRQQQQR
jgi:hypothetical protein